MQHDWSIEIGLPNISAIYLLMRLQVDMINNGILLQAITRIQPFELFMYAVALANTAVAQFCQRFACRR